VIVTVVFASADVQDIVPVEISPGATLADAVRASGLIAQYGLDAVALSFAVFGARTDGRTRLADGDRVEVLRPLLADPKAARARRARASPAGKPSRKGRRRGDGTTD